MIPAGVSGIEVELGQSTDPGLDPAKRVNEDACGYAETPSGHLFVVCDGMGGHAGGREASDIAIRTIFEVVGNAPPNDPGGTLVRAVEEAARRVYAFGGPPENLQRPGSTCVALLMHDAMVDVCHVGDSRAYAIRGKQIYRLTRDHSMVQELLDGGVISEQESIGHPDSNKITRALGMTPHVVVERREEPMDLYEGDVFVLATDGLTDLARNDDILVTVTEYLREKDVQGVCDELVAFANRRGGHDNITVQVIRVVRAGKGGRTRVQAPLGEPGSASPAGHRPLADTIDGPPVASGNVSPTVVQEPHDDFGTEGMLTTQPDAAGPTMIDPGLSTPAPMMQHMPVERGVQGDPAAGASNMIYIVLAMAGVIGLLLALLMWALFFR